MRDSLAEDQRINLGALEYLAVVSSSRILELRESGEIHRAGKGGAAIEAVGPYTIHPCTGHRWIERHISKGRAVRERTSCP